MGDAEEYDDYLVRESAKTREMKRMRQQSVGAEELRLCSQPPPPIRSDQVNDH